MCPSGKHIAPVSCRKGIRSCLLVVWLIAVSQLNAQDKYAAISQAADRYFDKEQYYKSAQYYQVALIDAPNDSYINYQLAHSYREIFDYPMAEIYYQKTVDLDTKNYPLALFYYPLMQKANGKFDQAITNFNSFLTFAEKNANISLQDRSRYLAQSIIEREGCIMALEQLSYPFKDYKFGSASDLNTAGNDYAPAMCANDPTLTITSARTGVKGSLQDNRFGELFSDNFRFRPDGLTWKAVKGGDNFEVTNSKFNDGAGSYNATGDKYYFTSCHGDNAFCKIYVSRKTGGHWQKPERLNQQINLSDFDSKHPSLSLGGDTLFFASNRPGGQGMMDIWMSTTTGGEQWGPALNLGKQVNTPFDEVSPYFHQEKDIFFFSSQGHQGLGELDVLMIEGFHRLDKQVRNIGPPFNSSYDDAFFVVDQEKGYLASNRPGGQGKFDIYQFNAQADESIMAELTEDGTVVDREALLRSRLRQYDKSALYAARDEDQFYYDNLTSEEKAHLERILIIKMQTEGKFNPKTSLSKEDFKFYRKLPIEDKARIERIAQLRAYQATPNDDQDATISYWARMDEQSQKDDAVYYEKLDPNERVIVDRIIAAKLEDKNSFTERKLKAEETEYYKALTDEEKTRITRIVQAKEIHRKLEENIATNAQSREFLAKQEQLEAQEYYDGLSQKVKSKVENIIASQSKKSFDAMALEDRELRYYSQLSSLEKARLQRLAGIREVEQEIVKLAKDNQEVRAVLAELDQPEDRLYYDGLNPTDQALTDQIVAAMVNDRTSFTIRKLNPMELHYFEGLSLKDQIRIDRIAQFKEAEIVTLASSAKSDSLVADNHSLTAIDIQDASEEQPVDLAHSAIEENQVGSEGIINEEASQKPAYFTKNIDSLYTNNAKVRTKRLDFDQPDDKLYYKGLSSVDQAMTDQIIASMIDDRISFSTRKLNPELANYFESLSLEDQVRIHRIARHRQAQNPGARQSEFDKPSDKQYYESLSPADQATTDQIIAAIIDDRESFAVRKLNPDQESYFNSLPLKDQKRIDRLAQTRQLEQVYATPITEGSDPMVNIDPKMGTISGQLYDLNKNGPAAFVPVPLIDHANQIVQVDTTDNLGRFEFIEVAMNRPYSIMGEGSRLQLHELPRYIVQDLVLNPIKDEVEKYQGSNGETVQQTDLQNEADKSVTKPFLASHTKETREEAYFTDEPKVFNHIHFGFDRSEISAEAETILRQLVTAYRENPHLTIEIQGHTDNIGPSNYNHRLSQKRGQAAVDYLIAQGVNPDHIIIVAKGEQEPIASNDTSSGRKLNRRVTFITKQNRSEAVVRTASEN